MLKRFNTYMGQSNEASGEFTGKTKGTHKFSAIGNSKMDGYELEADCFC